MTVPGSVSTTPDTSYLMAAATIAEEVVGKLLGLSAPELALATTIISHFLQAKSPAPAK